MSLGDTHTKTVTVILDRKPLAGVPEHTTPNAILGLRGIDAATHYLVRVEGRHQESYQGKGAESITVHEGETFVSVSCGPTPVS
jgi:hypothetical protein